MTSHPWSALGAIAAMAAVVGCGGIRVGAVSDGPAPALPDAVVAPPGAWHVVAVADAVVHSHGKWRTASLGLEDWLIAGAAAGRDAYWYTYLAFDLTTVPVGTTVAGAWIDLPLAPDHADQASPALDVHVVAGPWTEKGVSWSRQPLVAGRSSARVILGGSPDGSTRGDAADVTRVVNDALARGDARIAFVIVPAAPAQGAMRRWASREHLDIDAPSADAVPTLRLTAGPPPPPPSAATFDLASGGRLDITSR